MIKRFFLLSYLIKDIFIGCIGLLLIGVLLFREGLWCLCPLVLLPVWMIYCKNERDERHQRAIHREFRKMTAIIYSIAAIGYPLEKVMKDTIGEMERHKKEYPLLLPYMEQFKYKLKQQIPLDRCLIDLSNQSQDEDMLAFFQILLIARRSGGRMKDIVKQTIDALAKKHELNEDIDIMLAGKKHEFQVMIVIPLGILVYMSIFSAEYMDFYYTTCMGHCMMLLVLLIYVAAIMMGYYILKTAQL